jgi:hypothetical protein
MKIRARGGTKMNLEMVLLKEGMSRCIGDKMVIKVNLVIVTMVIPIFKILPSFYAHTPYYMKGYKHDRDDGKTGGRYGRIECSVSMSNKSCSDYVKRYNAGYSSTCGKNEDGCNNILIAIPDPFYASGWADGKKAAIHDLTNSSITSTRPNQTMENCPRTYSHGYWAGYKSGYT